MSAECRRCGVTAADLPYEELGLDLDTASEVLFEDGLCQGCAPQCCGVCLTGSDLGVPSAKIAYAYPGCPLHDPATGEDT